MMRPFGGDTHHRAGTQVTAGAAFLALVWLGTRTHELHASPAVRTLASLGDGIVAGAFVTGAVCVAVVGWRRYTGPLTGWIVATGALVAAQALLVTLVALQDPGAESLVSAAALACMLVVVVPLLGLVRVSHVVDDAYAIGLGMGLMAAGHLLLQAPSGGPPAAIVQASVGMVVATHVVTVVLVVRQPDLSRRAGWLLWATVAVVDVGVLAHVWGWWGAAGVTVLAIARAAAGAAWLAAGWAGMQHDSEDGDAQIRAEVDLVVQSSRREERERLHELRSTVAGLVNGAALLENPALTDDARRHLCESVHRELERMQRLLTGEHGTTTDIDVDQALQIILDLQRLKGRRVELHTDGGSVRARYDALAEAVNILMDNAETHGGCSTSRIDVVHRDGGTVDITISDDGRGIAEDQRERIFDWGNRGADSPGQGIGLHVARRLMTEDGGSLRLTEARGPGSAFVISLPAPRRSPEQAITGEEEPHVAWRLSS